MSFPFFRCIRSLSILIGGGLILLTLGGCAHTLKHEIHFNPTQPIRVAILPFVQVNEAGEIIEEDPNL